MVVVGRVRVRRLVDWCIGWVARGRWAGRLGFVRASFSEKVCAWCFGAGLSLGRRLGLLCLGSWAFGRWAGLCRAGEWSVCLCWWGAVSVWVEAATWRLLNTVYSSQGSCAESGLPVDGE
jgi:hypothetical protein